MTSLSSTGVVFPDDTIQTTSASNTIAIGQSYVDVNTSRALGTTYTNTTSKPIVVTVTTVALTGTSGTMQMFVNGALLQDFFHQADAAAVLKFTTMCIVPVNHTYSVTATGDLTLSSWVELR